MDKFLRFFGGGKKEEKKPDVVNLSSSENLSVRTKETIQGKKDLSLSVNLSDNSTQILLSENNEGENKIGVIFEEKTQATPNTKTDNAPKENLMNTVRHTPTPSTNTEVTIVNTYDHKKGMDEFYFKNYLPEFSKLQLSNPIIVEREKMKVTFDKEIFDYVINDMRQVFNEKHSIINSNHEHIDKGINETKQLIDSLYKVFNEDTINQNLDFYQKQRKFMNEIDNLEVIINALNTEVDNLIDSAEKINNAIR